MITISKINQIFYYRGALNFALSDLPSDIKGKIDAIFTVSNSGSALLSWRPTGISGFSSLVSGQGYYIVSKSSGFAAYDIDIDASSEQDQNSLVSKINVFLTYQGCSNFSLSDLSADVKSKISAIFTVSNSGAALLSWRPTGISGFTSMIPSQNYFVVSKVSGFASYDLGLPEKCSSSSSSSTSGSSSSAGGSSSSSSAEQYYCVEFKNPSSSSSSGSSSSSSKGSSSSSSGSSSSAEGPPPSSSSSSSGSSSSVAEELYVCVEDIVPSSSSGSDSSSSSSSMKYHCVRMKTSSSSSIGDSSSSSKVYPFFCFGTCPCDKLCPNGFLVSGSFDPDINGTYELIAVFRYYASEEFYCGPIYSNGTCVIYPKSGWTIWAINKNVSNIERLKQALDSLPDGQEIYTSFSGNMTLLEIGKDYTAILPLTGWMNTFTALPADISIFSLSDSGCCEWMNGPCPLISGGTIANGIVVEGLSSGAKRVGSCAGPNCSQIEQLSFSGTGGYPKCSFSGGELGEGNSIAFDIGEIVHITGSLSPSADLSGYYAITGNQILGGLNYWSVCKVAPPGMMNQVRSLAESGCQFCVSDLDYDSSIHEKINTYDSMEECSASCVCSSSSSSADFYVCVAGECVPYNPAIHLNPDEGPFFGSGDCYKCYSSSSSVSSSSSEEGSSSSEEGSSSSEEGSSSSEEGSSSSEEGSSSSEEGSSSSEEGSSSSSSSANASSSSEGNNCSGNCAVTFSANCVGDQIELRWSHSVLPPSNYYSSLIEYTLDNGASWMVAGWTCNNPWDTASCSDIVLNIGVGAASLDNNDLVIDGFTYRCGCYYDPNWSGSCQDSPCLSGQSDENLWGGGYPRANPSEGSVSLRFGCSEECNLCKSSSSSSSSTEGSSSSSTVPPPPSSSTEGSSSSSTVPPPSSSSEEGSSSSEEGSSSSEEGSSSSEEGSSSSTISGGVWYSCVKDKAPSSSSVEPSSSSFDSSSYSEGGSSGSMGFAAFPRFSALSSNAYCIDASTYNSATQDLVLGPFFGQENCDQCYPSSSSSTTSHSSPSASSSSSEGSSSSSEGSSSSSEGSSSSSEGSSSSSEGSSSSSEGSSSSEEGSSSSEEGSSSSSVEGSSSSVEGSSSSAGLDCGVCVYQTTTGVDGFYYLYMTDTCTKNCSCPSGIQDTKGDYLGQHLTVPCEGASSSSTEASSSSSYEPCGICVVYQCLGVPIDQMGGLDCGYKQETPKCSRQSECSPALNQAPNCFMGSGSCQGEGTYAYEWNGAPCDC